MAHDDERAAPPGHEGGESGAGIPVEVVRGLVEQRHRRPPQPDAGDRGEDRLAARQLADVAVEHLGPQSGVCQRSVRARFDVPVVADRVEMGGVGVARLDGAEGAQRRADAEQIRDGARDVERQPLRQIRHVAGRDEAGGRGELAGDESQERGLARAVAADEAGAGGAEGSGDVAEHG